MHTNQKQLLKNQDGFASLVISLVLILVLALLTVGFAQLARREQQNSLDKQLAVQANYAAETGINDAVQDINSGNINTSDNNNGQQCIQPSQVPVGSATAKPVIDNQKGVSYSCLLVGLNLPNLTYDPVAPGQGEESAFLGSPAITSMTVSWSSKNGRTTNANGHAFSGYTAWRNAGHPAVIEFSITPLDLTNSSRPYLINHTETYYLYPSGNNGTIGYGSRALTNSTGLIAPSTNTCIQQEDQCVKIIGLPGAPGYLIHLVNYYDDSRIVITGNDGQSTIIGGQAQVDVTGKARNVLKRLQVRVPINGGVVTGGSLPDFALEAQNVCKRQQVYPGQNSNLFVGPQGSIQDPPSDHPCDLMTP